MATEIIETNETFEITLESSQRFQIKGIIADMLAFSEQLIVNTEESYKRVTSLYRQARDWKKAIEAKRKELVEPLRAQQSAINDKAKELSDPLDQVISVANSKANGYQRMLEDQRRKEEEALKIAADLFDAADEVYVPPVERIIRGDGAVAVTKTQKKFKVADLSKVPLKYLTLDERAVERDIKLGINSIPGLEIYEETTTQLRVR